jgi:hypothetical protein
MKALIGATTIALTGRTATADWKGPWPNPDLSNSSDGYTELRTSRVHDPLEESYPGNRGVYFDDASGGTGATSYDRFVRGTPDIDVCGCV